MRFSKFFLKTQKDSPKDEAALNAKLLVRGGFIFKNSAGVYTYLPLGWKVIEKLIKIIREEMNTVGGEEMFMPAMVEKKYWQATGRWGVDIGFEVKGKNDREPSFVLGWSHEDILAFMATRFINSYKDLPKAVYQFQTKFRNEPRAKSGILRGREFLMKDLYSFHESEEDLFRYYDAVKDAYLKIFERCGLKSFYTLAAGGVFTISNTHEFQVLADVGEDTIFVCEKCEYAENSEISKLKNGSKCPKCGGKVLEKNSIEVGNIFPLGIKYSEAFGLNFLDKNGAKKPVVMGSYGIGVGRLMGAIVEVSHDDQGIIWPAAVAPFDAELVDLGIGKITANFYQAFQKAGLDILYDDRAESSAGEKLKDADLLGMPWRLVVSEKTIAKKKVEIKQRTQKTGRLVSLAQAIKMIKNKNENF